LVARRTGYEVEDLAVRGSHCALCGEELNMRRTVKPPRS
jgi:hypothetical protein